MPVRKIIAYFMHEKEEALIKASMINPQKTESYFIGEVDEGQYKKLLEEKIITQEIQSGILEEKREMHRLKRIDRVRGFTNIHHPDIILLRDEQEKAGFPAYYKFSIAGPLLEEYREQLHAANITILEFIPPDSYLVRLGSEDEFLTLVGLLFAKNITYYSSKDTGINIIKNTIPAHGTMIEKQIVPFDILLHRKEDMDGVIAWLLEKEIAIAGVAGKKIRVYLLEDSAHRQEIASHTAVQSFDQYIPPKLHNDVARGIMGMDAISNGQPNLEFDGDGQVVGVADTGIDISHPDFENQVHKTPTAWGRENDFSDFDGHGSHVAGSIVGNGASSDGKIKGTAPGAKVFFQSIMNSSGELNLPLQLQMLFQEAYDNGVRVHNNSWGSATSSRYTINAIEVDDFVAANRDMLLVFSAGNEGNAFNPINAPAGFPDFLSIGSPGSAKNILTVGASRSLRTEGGYCSYNYGDIWPSHFPNPPLSTDKVSGDSNALAGFSSRGPCDDNRIKPDVVAPGTDIASVKSSEASLSSYWGILPGNNKYAIMGGTSMAAPLVAGCAAVVREYYQKAKNHGASAALVKATIINGCKKLTGVDCIVKFPDLPNYNQGFGMVDMVQTIPGPANNFFLRFEDNYKDPTKHFRFTGQAAKIQFKLTVNTWLRICLVYTDIPGRALQNNLNLMLAYNLDNTKWIGNENVPSLLKMPDTTNNVEVINIENAKAGEYTLLITATNIIKGYQDFAYVITSGDINAN